MSQFNEWRSTLLVVLNDKDLPVEEHLKMCTEFVNQIIEYNCLLGNPELTESFLKDTLIPAIRQILRIKICFSTKGKANCLINFLKSCLALIPWAYMIDRVDLFRPLNDILDQNQNLYTSIVSSSSIQTPKNSRKNNKYTYTPSPNKAPNPVLSIYDYFISHELFTVMTLRFQRNDEIPILLEHLYFFLFNYNQMSEKISETASLALLYTFFNFFENFISVNILPTKAKLIDQKQILSIFTLVIELANKYSYEVQDSVLQLIFDYGNHLIKESNLESQLFGTSIFKIFTESKDRSLYFFTQNIQKTNFVTDFMSRDLHPDVIENTIPILTKMSGYKCIKLSDLKQICIITKNVHNTQKDKMINLTVDLLLELRFEDVSDFFNSNMDDSFDFLNLITNYLLKKKDVPNDLVQDFISKIILIGSNIYFNKKSDGDYAINNIIKPVFNSKYKKIFLSNCFTIIMKEYNQFAVVLMQSIASSSTLTIRSDFNQEIYNKLCSFLPSLDIQQRTSVYPLIYILSYSLQIKCSLSLLKQIMNVDDNSMWTFLYSLLIKSGLSSFENDSIKFIAEFIQNMKTLPENRNFAEFFKVFMLLYNVFTNNIIVEKTRQKKVIPAKYSVRKLPLYFEEKLIDQILTFNDPGLIEISSQTFLDIYSHLETKSSSYDIFVHLLEKAANDDQIIHVIELIFLYCLKNDKEPVTKLISHSFSDKSLKEELKNPLILKAQFNLNNKEPPSGEIIQIQVNRDTPVQAILALLSPNLPEAPSKYVVKLRNVEKNNCNINFQNGFQSNSYVEIFNRGPGGQSILSLNTPSEYLRNLGFTKKILIYFNDKSHSEELLNQIWKLLNYLPSDEELQELSAKPDQFLAELKKATNKYYIRYLYQILLWRLRSMKYQNLYSSELQNVLSEVVNQDDLAAFCADEIVCLLEIYPLPEFIVPALKILSNKDIKESTKRIASSIISQFKFDTTSIVENKANVDLIMKAIAIMSPKVWEEFKKFLFQIKNEKILYTMSINALTKNLPNPQYFTELFSLYLPNFLVEDSSRQISLCLKLLKDNPSIGLATALNKIIVNNIQNEIKSSESMPQIVDEITSIIEICNETEILNKLFDTISKINSYDKSARPSIDNFISKINNIKLDRWSFVPDLHTQKYRGLRNLQATCYMNSDLQQLYHIPAFRYLVSKEATEGEGIDDDKRDFITSLQFLFSDMVLMKTRYCDPEVFFFSWSKLHNNYYQANEQQDAQEFLTFFFEDIPKKSKSLFEGISVTTTREKSSHNNNNNNDDDFDDDSVGFIQSREESFCTLPLPIKDFDNMNDSLHSIYQTQVLFGDNQYALEGGRKIDAEQIQRIKVAPPVLIIQLKRFEFDITTQDRIKINKKFEILKNISLKEFMINETKNDSDYNYTLHGVVVHRGEGSHGHYTSLINIDNDWFKFDDMDVQKVDEKVFREEAFGSDEDNNKNNNKDQFEYYYSNNINGYLLFYINEDAKVDGKLLLDNSFDFYVPEEKRLLIDKQNKHYLFEQFAFLEPTFHFFNEISNPDQLRDYFFNVFSHSKQNAKELSLLIVERMKELYQNNPQLIDDLLTWMSDNFKEKILDIYIRCSVIDIVNALSDLILFCCSNSPVEKSGPFIGQFIDELQQLIPKWRQISEICKMIINYFKISPLNIEFAQNMGWTDLILIFIYEVFNGSRSDNALKIINISEVFEIAKIIVSLETSPSYMELPNIRDMVSKSPQSFGAYKSLLVKCTSLDIFDISEMKKLIPDEFSRPKMMEMYLSKVTPTNFNQIVVDKLEKEMKYQRYLIMTYIISKKNDFKAALIANPLYMVESLLLSGNEYNDLASKTEKFMIELYQDKEIEMENKKEVLNKMIDIIPTLKQRKEVQLSPFLHVLLVLLRITNYPRNSPIKGLEELKSQSDYMLAVSAYSDSSQLISIFESKAKKIIFNNIPSSVSLVSTNKFVTEFTPVLESASTDLFLQLINRSEWNQIIEKYKSAYSGFDLLTLNNLLDVIIMKNSLLMSENPVPVDALNMTINFIVKIMTMNGSCESQYASNFAKYLPSFIDNVKDPKIIETLFRVVCNVFNTQNLAAKPREELINTYFVFIPSFMYKHTNTNLAENEEKVSDEEAKMFKEAFSRFSVQRVDNVCSFISNIKREDTMIAMQFLVCVSTFNDNYRKELTMFAESKMNTVSPVMKGSTTKSIDNFIMAALLFLLEFISPNGEKTIDKMVSIYNHASKGYQGKREAMFQILNKLQTEKSRGWSGIFASKIFDSARYDKDEERNFFRIALPKMKREDDIKDLLRRCAEKFNLIGVVQSSSKDDAANQLEKIALLVESFSDKMKREEIIGYFKIDKNWAGQSGRFEKAIEAIFGKEENQK